ncbi:MAG TPA: hypothetical protein ENK57_17900, partial [Polyangiaceae bacterium]|nr:hypothetical protein [Polyangiaceae bacterium]
SRFPPSADGFYYHRLAERLASGEGYTWRWPDGVVTYAAHYPVGYPGLLAGPYALFGARPLVAMIVNAVVGALGCWAIYAATHRHVGRRTAALAGLLAAAHPALVFYTPALMTEGVVAAVWAAAAWLAGEAAGRDRERPRWGWLVAASLVMGIATLVRPQSVLLAPFVGSVAWPKRRWLGALLATALTVGCCVPWTLRNCERMGRCAFVSVNGGWNMLIGTDPAGRGGWAELKVPEACIAVFDEAAKDACFAQAARETIASAPMAWLALVPRKLAVTFDYAGAPGWYLHASNPDVFGARAKLALGVVETVFQRVLLAAAILAAWWRGRRRGRWRGRERSRATVAVTAALATCWEHAFVAWLALPILLLSSRPRWRRPTWAMTIGAVASLAVVHAVFFGAGRYQLVVWLVILGPAADGLSLLRARGAQLARRRRQAR